MLKALADILIGGLDMRKINKFKMQLYDKLKWKTWVILGLSITKDRPKSTLGIEEV